jgi:hypothetical protein
MLDPKEIRTGNWVIKVTGKDSNTKSFFEYKAIALDEYYYTFAKVCFPITVTVSILGKCGFEHEQGNWFITMKTEGREVSLRYQLQDKCWYLQQEKIPLQPLHLHQLQNLYYALCGEELKISLGFFENVSMIGPIDFFVKPHVKSALIRELL